MPRLPFKDVRVRAMPEMSYLVFVDGTSDAPDTPYRGLGGLKSALIDASAIKADEPSRTVTIEIVHP